MVALRNLQLNWLRTFEAVARYSSFSGAATQLNMSQSAVSQQISLLEHKLGRELFVRRNRSIEPTVAGRAYLGVVREALQHIEQGTEGIFNTLAEGVLELSVNNSFAQLWLSPRFKRFTTLYPQVSVRMYGVNWEADAPPTSAELEIRYGRGVWAGFETTALLSHVKRPYCSRALAVEVRKNGGLRDSTLIDVLGASIGWTEWIAQHSEGRPPPHQRLLVDSYAIAAEMAAHDVGITLLTEDLIVESRLRDALVSPLDQTVEEQASFYLLHARDKPMSAAARAFVAWLQSERNGPARG
jgi:LysR family transcriptional regulator, glycine cleavage system transcriptional activator